jgi:hypothetical protein
MPILLLTATSESLVRLGQRESVGERIHLGTDSLSDGY